LRGSRDPRRQRPKRHPAPSKGSAAPLNRAGRRIGWPAICVQALACLCGRKATSGKVTRQVTKRLLTVLLTVVICVLWLIPAADPRGHTASAQTLANGLVVSGDFKGAGYSQIVSLFDAADNLGVRISVLERTGAEDKFTAGSWYQSGENTLDLGRMK